MLAVSLLSSVPAFADADNDWLSRAFGYSESMNARPEPRRAPRRAQPRPAPKPKVAVKPVAPKVVTKPKATQKAEPKATPKAEPKATPKVEPKIEPNDAPAKVGKVQVDPSDLDKKLARFDHVDPQHLIAREPLKAALAAYAMNQHKLSNSRYLGVIDFSKNSSKARFCVITMSSGETECMKTSHGVGSDGGGGWARTFSNRVNSHASSVGVYKTLSTYDSKKHGTALRMDGLSATNSNALGRAIVIHRGMTRSGVAYVSDRNQAPAGRSHGCPALDPQKTQRMIAQLKGGAIIYAWHPKFMNSPAK